MQKTKLGQQIKDRRKELTINQTTLAELAEVSLNTLYKIERGQSNPSLAVLTRILDVLGLELVIRAKSVDP